MPKGVIMKSYNLLKGNCLELIQNIKDKSIDLIITDPPYNFESMGGGFYAKNKIIRRTYCESLSNINCCKFSPSEFLDLLKPKMVKFYGYFFCNKTLIKSYIDWSIKNKFNYDVLVMAKSNPIPAFNNHHLSDLEYIVLIREKGTYFSKHKKLDDFRKFYITNCKKGIHPAEKPVELLERFVKVSSKECNLIFDPFMGSGSTGIAALNMNRKFLGIELDNHYFNVAKNRIENINMSKNHI
jgi:DNA modification methylase